MAAKASSDSLLYLNSSVSVRCVDLGPCKASKTCRCEASKPSRYQASKPWRWQRNSLYQCSRFSAQTRKHETCFFRLYLRVKWLCRIQKTKLKKFDRHKPWAQLCCRGSVWKALGWIQVCLYNLWCPITRPAQFGGEAESGHYRRRGCCYLRSSLFHLQDCRGSQLQAILGKQGYECTPQFSVGGDEPGGTCAYILFCLAVQDLTEYVVDHSEKEYLLISNDWPTQKSTKSEVKVKIF